MSSDVGMMGSGWGASIEQRMAALEQRMTTVENYVKTATETANATKDDTETIIAIVKGARGTIGFIGRNGPRVATALGAALTASGLSDHGWLISLIHALFG